MNRNILRQAGLVVGGISIGGGAGYILAKKHLKAEYRKVALDAIEEAKDFYSLLRSEPPFDNPVTAAKAYRERMVQLDYWVAHGIPQEDMAAYSNLTEDLDAELDETDDEGEVFINEQPNPEPEVELEEPHIYNELVRERHVEAVKEAVDEATENIRMTVEAPTQANQIISLEDVTSQPTDIRNVFHPDVVKKYELEVKDELPQTSKFTYVITVDEFMEENHDMDKVSLMYYEGDDTLADDSDKIVKDLEAIVGRETLKFFGKGSQDENVVYVKNTDRKMLIEICKDARSYPVAVFGIPNSILNKKVPRSDDG